MFGKEDIAVDEVAAPPGRYCFSGHVPPPTFVLDTKARPTRFYRVSARSSTRVNGVYCELCMVAARYIAKHPTDGDQVLATLEKTDRER